ncbi:MAG: M24 family metallopeptidase [Bacilli bacterium]|nr:M24 family metallopeptidase [Bacilli bacterium]
MEYRNENLIAIRAEMKKRNLKGYLIVTGDPHNSEEPAAYFGAERRYACPFSGDNAYVLITEEEALLWTDGRFFISAEKELKGSPYKLMKMATPGYPSLEEYLNANDIYPLGTNFLMFAENSIKDLSKGGKEVVDCDLSFLMEDRPALSKDKLWRFDGEEYNTLSREEKIDAVFTDAKKKGAKAALVSTLDDIAWILNIRGNDVAYTPVFYSYLYIEEEGAHLFVEEGRVDFTLPRVKLHPYGEIDAFLEAHKEVPTLVDPDRLNAHIYRLFAKPVNGRIASNLMKAIKGEKEIANIIKAQEQDGVALLKFIAYWESHKDDKTLSEFDYAKKLGEYRAEGKDYIEDSFQTIAAYGPNAAMMHYAPNEEVASLVDGSGQELLVDSGGQYFGGTTDTTRTFLHGEPTDEYRHDYTLTLKSVIALSRAVFLEGTPGTCLDFASREIMWREGLDYKCGTGHGVGYLLPVHEGPNGFRYRLMPGKDDSAPNVPGMVTTVEPGVYKEGKYGIRIENNLLTVFSHETNDGRFFKFKNVTFVPIETKALDLSMMSDEEIGYLNSYHQEVREHLTPYVSGDLLSLLLRLTSPLKR